MLASAKPSKIQLPFANSGTKNTIPVASQIAVTPGAASYTDGFPPLTFTPIASGGVPPSGADFNGILNIITAFEQWQGAGGLFGYDAAFSTAISGYPKGAILVNSTNDGYWMNLSDGNTTDPDGGTAANWASLDTYGIGAVAGLTNANVTLTPSQWGNPIITLAGTLTANVQILFPTTKQLWTVINNTTGAFTVTCKTAAGTGAAVQQGGISQDFYGDGTNLVPVGGNADQTTVDAGTDDVKFVTSKKLKNGFSFSFGTNSYIKVPSWLGGWILQFGVMSATDNALTTLTLPLTYTNACRCLIALPVYGSVVGGVDILSAYGIVVNTSQIQVGLSCNNAAVTASQAYWATLGN